MAYLWASNVPITIYENKGNKILAMGMVSLCGYANVGATEILQLDFSRGQG